MFRKKKKKKTLYFRFDQCSVTFLGSRRRLFKKLKKKSVLQEGNRYQNTLFLLRATSKLKAFLRTAVS